ncbi:MAG: dihydrofolate reductase [Coriobacteriia bacterium]|nr:dihydrofolate reductase [Coriobacteriia bacterium]
MQETIQKPDGMKIKMIWAQDRSAGLGDGKRMLWHVPADFKHFKAETLGFPVLMGKNSFKALGSALPGRENIVITRSDETFEHARRYASIQEALDVLHREGKDLVWIVGGASVYQQMMDVADELVISHVDLDVNAPVKAPVISEDVWEIDHEHSDSEYREKSGDAAFKVVHYIRKDK